MSKTVPLPISSVNRISERLKAIQAKPDCSETGGSMMCLPADPGVAWQEFAEDFSVWGYGVSEERGIVLLPPEPISPLEIFVEFRAPSAVGGTDAERLIDASSVQALLCREEPPRGNLQWEEYPEPLWDPLESEVELIVREYFEQADADFD